MLFKRHKKENVGIVDTIEVIVNKKRGNANFEIKHDGNGKETMIIACKDENGKEKNRNTVGNNSTIKEINPLSCPKKNGTRYQSAVGLSNGRSESGSSSST